ncbi:alcohol dehydrogenase [Fusarium albosuccineum]|uniref:Alcohol dehydrogenase n=1 Tax=Fusarium albosuccineum TaxID=1237068 RepID=A0A8H4NZX6_9HYPO|nr:alcohol dehydrogenase [Fusarium albosuccineum]
MVPQTQRQWVLSDKGGLDSLEFQQNAPIPSVGNRDILVQIHAASLNFRDLLLAKGMYPFPRKEKPVPLSDGAGVVVAIGPRVTRFQVGDQVATLFHQDHLAGSLDAKIRKSSLGGSLDGVFREYGVFPEHGLVSIPRNLSLAEAASLPCAALTAWSALYDPEGRAIKQGDIVLTEGTGGVSIFAVQFAKSAGAKVIATTSSAEKAERLKQLGVDHVINYKGNPQWGETVKALTPDEEGVSRVVEVGGSASLRQALTALKLDGVISMVGTISGFTDPDNQPQEPTFLETVLNSCTVRGIGVGSRIQFEQMNRAIEANDIHPVLDKKVFKMDDAREAFEYLWDQKHFGKVIVQII